VIRDRRPGGVSRYKEELETCGERGSDQEPMRVGSENRRSMKKEGGAQGTNF